MPDWSILLVLVPFAVLAVVLAVRGLLGRGRR